MRPLRLDRPILSAFGPLVAAELCTGRSRSSKMRCTAPNGEWPLCAEPTFPSPFTKGAQSSCPHA